MKSNAIFVGMAIAISALVAACDRSDSEVAARKKLSKLEEAAARYKNDCGQFPDKAEDLRKNPGVDAWQGPYFEGTLDPWGIPYQFEVVEERLKIRSYGPDRVAQTEDDVTN